MRLPIYCLFIYILILLVLLFLLCSHCARGLEWISPVKEQVETDRWHAMKVLCHFVSLIEFWHKFHRTDVWGLKFTHKTRQFATILLFNKRGNNSLTLRQVQEIDHTTPTNTPDIFIANYEWLLYSTWVKVVVLERGQRLYLFIWRQTNFKLKTSFHPQSSKRMVLWHAIVRPFANIVTM